MTNSATNQYNVLENYVNLQIPKLKTISQADLNSMFEGFETKNLVKNSKISETELIETFRLSMITESLTEQYADTFVKGALDFEATWLSNYIQNFWVPDELGHMDPFKNVLLDLGYNESELEQQIKDAKEQTDYLKSHSSDISPIALTTYGMVQECVTDFWYELQLEFFPIRSGTRKAISKIKGREALHTVQFRDLTCIQLEKDPTLLLTILETITKFQMPGNHINIVKDIEKKSKSLIPKMNGEVIELVRRIIQHTQIVLQDTEKIGKLFALYGSKQDKQLIKYIPNNTLFGLFNFVDSGHGLIGEIILEKIGLYANEFESLDSNTQRWKFKIKKIIKKWINDQFEIEEIFK
ncbi:MAG: hypothetical protein FI687_05450 [SAR202 cluster bacterium]|nr:hypothetical protein [SAR202 cluster bacterium]|tara:strand:- start:5372 stop:6430 length:1059 start_codon:yes stop_codon:yes gene_type:complete